MGTPFAENGNYTEAEKSYLLAIKIDKTYALPYKSIGLLYYNQKNREKALWYLEKYLPLAPDARDFNTIQSMIHDLGRESS